MVTVLCTELSFVLRKNTLSINVSFLCTDCGVFAFVFPYWREGGVNMNQTPKVAALRSKPVCLMKC